MNKIILMGRLTKDVEVTATANGNKVAKFSLAVNRPKRGEKEEADFFRVTVFGKQAEACEKYIAKGSLVLVKGRIQTGTYTNKDGDKVNAVDIIASRVTFLKEGGGNENDATLIGRLTADPEISYTSNTNTCVAKFSLAVDRPRRNGEVQGADFIRVTVFGKPAENVDRYIGKGRQIAVEGSLQLGSYTNKEGKIVNTHDLIAERIEFLGSGAGKKSSDDSDSGFVDLPDEFEDDFAWDEDEEF